MENIDIRWIQRFNNYKRALNQLNEAIKLFKQRELSMAVKLNEIKLKEENL